MISGIPADMAAPSTGVLDVLTDGPAIPSENESDSPNPELENRHAGAPRAAEESFSVEPLAGISQSPTSDASFTIDFQPEMPCFFGCPGLFSDLESHISLMHPDPGQMQAAPIPKVEKAAKHQLQENESVPTKRRCVGLIKSSVQENAFLEKMMEVLKQRALSHTGDTLYWLREVARVVNFRTRNIVYESSVDDGKGYCESYLMRLDELLGESNEAGVVLLEVGELLRLMDEGKIEYQCPNHDILDLIKRAAANGKQEPALYLCSYLRFYGRDLGDAGWGCGYRNAQMLIAALLEWPDTREHLRDELGSSNMPNISALQGLLQNAWAKGFSQNAAAELNDAVLETSKWIGTTEIQALFSSLKLECYIKDFSHAYIPPSIPPNKVTDSKTLKGECLRLQREMFEFVQNYFTKSLGAFQPPLYIQYEGHSRTVIGVDVTELAKQDDPAKLMEKVGFLIFDPANTQWDIDLRGNPTRKWYKEKVFCAMSSFKEPMYQILYFTGKNLSEEAYQSMKLAGYGHDNFQEEFEDYSHLLRQH